MNCNKCHKENRAEAVYCRHCGTKLPQGDVDPFVGVIGLPEVRRSLNRFLDNIRCIKDSGDTLRLQCDTIIIGPTGSGKTMLTEVITRALYGAGLVKHPKPVVVDAVDWDSFINDWEDNVKRVKDGVLVVENVQKLVPDDYSKMVESIDRLVSAMDQWNGNPVVILSGLPWGMREYIDKNHDVRRRFEYEFRLADYDGKELAAIAIQTLLTKYNVSLDAEAYGKMERVMQYVVRNKPKYWTNGHHAVNVAQETYLNMRRRGASIVEACDIEGKEHRDLTTDEIIGQLDDFVGIDNIKDELRKIINYVNVQKSKGKTPRLDHYVFVGNPGTGKTTIARKFGEIFRAMGALPIGHLVEAKRDDMVEGYVGQTAPKTNTLIDKAIGGVLFIDEAYTLAQGGNGDFGKEAIDTLLKRMEDDRGKFICIVAGYPKEMHDFIQTNPGLKSRFNKEIHFHDYDGDALTEIFRRAARREGQRIDAAAERSLPNFFKMLAASNRNDFGNARAVESILREAVARQIDRLQKLAAQGVDTSAMEDILTREDIEGEENTRELNLDDVLAEIDNDFVGMDNVKKTLRKIGKTVEVMKRQASAGTKVEPYELHMLITGNPGTGKTEVARKLGKVLKALHVLPSDEVIEVTKRDMITGTVGGAPAQTDKTVDRAMGKILFIDEAYQLANDEYGRDAIVTLMRRMTADAGKFVLVLAGYRREMDQFLDVNPGLARRFSERLHIEDYTQAELLQIFEKMVTKKGLRLSPQARVKAELAVDEIYSAKTKDFGNAGEMDKLLKATRARMSNRIFDMENPSADNLLTIMPEDIPAEERKHVEVKDVLRELDDLVGLEGVKRTVRELANNLRVEKMMAESEGRRFQAPDDHYLFLGNPGTGKTTVARIMSKIFLQLGITKNSKFVETDRSGLVGKYVGDTAPLTNSVVDSAMGGLLFIDEAYTLAQGGPHDFGPEAIATLLKRLEDDRGKFVCIAAGYTREMQAFLRANSGLTSRFNQTIYFDDYGVPELAEIFRRTAAKDHLRLSPEADRAMAALLQRVYDRRDEHFGNARTVRNIYKKVKSRQRSRIVGMMDSGTVPTPEQMHEILPQDVDIDTNDI